MGVSIQTAMPKIIAALTFVLLAGVLLSWASRIQLGGTYMANMYGIAAPTEVVLVRADWCGACKGYMREEFPKLQTLAENSGGAVNVKDWEESKNAKQIAAAGVRIGYYPTLLMRKAGAKEYIVHKGDRNAHAVFATAKHM